ncbi:hypothetical protein RJT34_15526 [Clitoria ternatea]|uniref:Uncharacterized protein n=1 Tax=Clitoria ternatea TaxID=43366 RepID=A0AAN9J5L5_CLITE
MHALSSFSPFSLPRLLDTRRRCSLLPLPLACYSGDLVPPVPRVCLLFEAPSVAGRPSASVIFFQPSLTFQVSTFSAV